MGLLSQLSSDPMLFILLIIVLLIALTCHEAAHALVAKRLGDDTAERLGRLTLNPLAHLDPIGSLAILLVGFGWGKPVPVNPNNFQNPKLDNLKVALAGPVTNFALALLFSLFARLFHPESGSLAFNFTQLAIQLNLVLMIFNLIPLPPLDGSKLIHLFISEEQALYFDQYGTYLLLGLIIAGWFGFPIISALLGAPVDFLYRFLVG